MNYFGRYSKRKPLGNCSKHHWILKIQAYSEKTQDHNQITRKLSSDNNKDINKGIRKQNMCIH